MHLSIIIPAYNEAGRIAQTLGEVNAYLERQSYDSEMLVVDDGSTDDTAALVRRDFPKVRLLSHTPNRGKGYAVRKGMLAASGAYRLFYDADGSTPISEVEKVWSHFADGAAAVIGSRALPGSKIATRQAWYRESMGRAFNRIVRILTLTRFADTQCGFKAFSAACCDAVFPRQTIDGFSFDVEVLYICMRHKWQVKEVPIRWVNCPRTTLNAVTDSARMFLDVLKIRLNAAAGRYD